MPSGTRLLNQTEEEALLAEVDLRERLTDKALARRYRLTLRQIQTLVLRLRRRREQQSENKCTFLGSQ